MCLEGEDKGCVKGSVSSVRKAKSLVGRWLEKCQVVETKNKSTKESGTKVIERDTIVSAKVVIGRGASSVNVIKQY